MLKKYINFGSEDDFVLLVSWLIGSMRPTVPFPILIVQGEQGSTKSTTCEIIKKLVDPSTPMFSSMPTMERDSMISSKNGWVKAFDNISYISSGISDILCRISTGGGYSTRKLHSDDEEMKLIRQFGVVRLTSLYAYNSCHNNQSLHLYLPQEPDIYS